MALKYIFPKDVHFSSTHNMISNDILFVIWTYERQRSDTIITSKLFLHLYKYNHVQRIKP